MATGTNNLLDTGTVPIPVPDGGTGVASTTAYAVVCGGTSSTAALQPIASVGSFGQVLTSNGAGALPTFQAAGGSPYYLDPVLDVLDANSQTIVCTYYNGPGNDGIGATLTNNDGLFTVFTADGDTPPVGSAILVVNMSNPAYNGIYVLTVAGDGVSVNWVLERRADCNQTSNIINGISVFVFGENSNNYFFTTWILTNGVEPFVPLVIGTDAIYFNQATYGYIFPYLFVGSPASTNIAFTPTGMSANIGLGGSITLTAYNGGSVILETQSVVFGQGGSCTFSLAGYAGNNIQINNIYQIFNMGGNPILGLYASGLQIGGSGATVTTISTDGTFAGAVDTTLSTSLAIKTYVDSQIGGSGAVNPGLINELAYYAAAGDAVSGLATAINGVLVTDGSGVPSISTTLPAVDASSVTGTASGLTAGTVTTNADLTGDVTSTGNATTLTNSAVTGQALTGYSISSGTVLATDSILQAIEKIAGNTGGGGTVLSVQTFTSGSGTYTPTAGANWIWVRAVGGGGGGGGCTSGVTQAGAGGAGGAGAYGEYWGAAASLAYAVGAAGAAGTAGGAGGNGTATTLGTAGAQLNLAFGVGGATVSNHASAVSQAQGGAGGAATTATLGIAGQAGNNSASSTTIGVGGQGADSLLGVGGPGGVAGVVGSANGQASTGYGSGGGGSVCSSTSGSATGGAGASGVIIITEYA